MTAQQHYELYKQLNEQAGEWLRKAMSHEYAFQGMDEFNEYVRLYKLARKHYGIYQAVQTRKHRAWCREHGMAYSY